MSYRVSLQITERLGQSEVLHCLPVSPLKLWGSTKPDSVSSCIKTRRIVITFRKQLSSEWPRLGSDKWSWIRFDFESFDIEENNNSELSVRRNPMIHTSVLPVVEDSGSNTESDIEDGDDDSDGEEEFIIKSENEEDPDLDAEEL